MNKLCQQCQNKNKVITNEYIIRGKKHTDKTKCAQSKDLKILECPNFKLKGVKADGK